MTCVYLRWLAMTCVHFDRAQICTQVNAILSPFGHPTQVNASWLQHCFPLFGRTCKASLKWLFCLLCWTCVYLRFRLATHRKSVFAISHFLTCVDLQLRLAKALRVPFMAPAQGMYEKMKHSVISGKTKCFWETFRHLIWRFTCLRLTVFQIKGTFNVHTYRIDTTVLLKQYIFTRY